MLYRRRFFRFMNDEPGDTGGTGVIDAPVVDASAAPGVTPPVAEAPKTMAEAMFPTEVKPEPAVVAEKPADPLKPAEVKPEELTKMPEGLSPGAQERFQKLANVNKELTAKHDSILQAVQPFQQTLQENGVRKEQFDQAAGVIGMINKGDLEGALKMLDDQRRQISLALGKPLPGVDALSEFPDLRQRVDNMQMTEEDAMELARSRASQTARVQSEQQRQQQEQQQNQQRQQQETSHKAISDGLTAVDAFTNKMKAEDLDFAAVEAKLLPRIPALIEGVPPQHWAAKVQTLYEMIKETAGSTRTTTTNVNALRPTGQKSPQQKPSNMFEAMFGQKA